MKKILLLSLAAIFLPLVANAAVLSSTFNTGTAFPNSGATTSVSSTCGVSGANSTATFALFQNGAFTSLGTVLSTDSNGNFAGNVAFPTNYGPGQAFLVATCTASGNTINSPVLTFAAPASTSFSLPGTVPTVGGILTISGACGASNGTGSVNVTLNQNSNTFNLGNFNLNSIGTFSNTVAIPNSSSIGSATLAATCSNSTTFSSNLNLGPQAVNGFGFGSNPAPGSTTTTSGNCTNVGTNANGPVSFSVLRNGITTTLSATNNLTNNGSFFNSSVFFPTTLGTDPATFVITCPNGSTFSNVIMLGAASISDPTTPVGGVTAGFEPSAASHYLVGGEILLAALALGVLVFAGKNFYAQK